MREYSIDKRPEEGYVHQCFSWLSELQQRRAGQDYPLGNSLV